MLEKTLGILFFLKQPQNYQGGATVVYLRLTVNGVSSEISTKRKWEPARWDSRKGRASGTKDDAKALNTFIELLAYKVHEARRKLIDANKEVSAAAIKNLLFGVDENKYVIQVFREHNESIKPWFRMSIQQGHLTCLKGRSCIRSGLFNGNMEQMMLISINLIMNSSNGLPSGLKLSVSVNTIQQ